MTRIAAITHNNEKKMTDQEIIDLHDSMFPRVVFEDDVIGPNIARFARAILAAQLAERSDLADFTYSRRFQWLCEDHEDFKMRGVRNDILRRLPTMSLSAVCQAIDYAMVGEYALPDPERAAFEAWIKWHGGSIDRIAPGEYRSAPTECAWGAWQARAAIPKATVCPENYGHPHDNSLTKDGSCCFCGKPDES